MQAAIRCVITGLGPVTPIGIGKNAFWSSLADSISNYSEITRFDLEDWDQIRIAAQIKDFDPAHFVDKQIINSIDKLGARNGGLSLFYGVAGARLAIEDAGLDVNAVDLERGGVIAGSGSGDLSIIRRGNINFVRSAMLWPMRCPVS